MNTPILPLFIWSPEEEGDWPPGGASRWWLNHSLVALQAELRRARSCLTLRLGPALQALQRIISETGAATVLWNRRYEPAAREREEKIKDALAAVGVVAQTFNAALLHEPWTIHNRAGRPFQVFTPFWKHCLSLPAPPQPLPMPVLPPPPKSWPRSARLQDFLPSPVPDWAGGLEAAWQPGEHGAARRFERFLAGAFARYETGRNRPDLEETSRLSPHLHFGELSPRQIWHQVKGLVERAPREAGNSESRLSTVVTQGATESWRQSQFITELGWREFAHHLLHHFPNTPAQPLRAEYARFRWRKNPAWLSAWQRGQTGYPFIDAGMRELWTTGWMHNRVRMVVASFLVKDLLISWEEGARWFWDTLVDADLAQNTLGWQWSAGCGADAAPFFRIFNPVTQGEKFDPNGTYVRRWVPELAALSDQWIQKPFAAPANVLEQAGIKLGKTYPRPIVNHILAREIALEAYGRLKAKSD